MKYAQKSFSVRGPDGDVRTCAVQGHAFADVKGKCVRCGNKIRATGFDAPLSTRLQDADPRAHGGRVPRP